MEHLNATKKKIVFEIEQLSNPYIIELQNFIQYLKFKQASTTEASCDSDVLQPEEDPILRAFGFIDVSPFSKTIDDTLYGSL